MHAFAVAFSLMLVWIIITTMNTLVDQHREFVGKKEIVQVCDIMKTSVEKIMIPQDYVSRTNTTLGRLFVAMPEKVGGLKYRTRFSGDQLVIETLGTPFVNDTCVLGFNATFRGGTPGGRTEIIYFRYSNGTDEVNVAGV